MPTPHRPSPPRPPLSVAREFFLHGTRRRSPLCRTVVAGGRCLGVAVLACLLTRPLLHPARTVVNPKRIGAPVSVTADVSRRLAAGSIPAVGVEDPVLWAGLE